MHLVGFIIRIYHDAGSSERQILPETKSLIMPIWPDSCIKTDWISNVPKTPENHSFLTIVTGRKFLSVVTRLQNNLGVRQDSNHLN